MSKIKEYLTVVVTERTNVVYEKGGVIYVPEQRMILDTDEYDAECAMTDARRNNPTDRVVQLESVRESKPYKKIFEEII